jgi:hypothetical protein
MPRRASHVAALAAALSALLCAAAGAAPPRAAPATGSHDAAALAPTALPVRLTAAFDRDARLGASTALLLGVRVDTRLIPSPVSEVQLRYPASLGITTSGLGLDACRRRPRDFAGVVISGTGLAGCPRNSVMARGTVAGEIRLGTRTIPEVGTVAVLAGPLQQGRLGLVTLVEGWNPIGALLAYRGSVVPAPAPYGGALALSVVQIPPAYGATIALSDLSLAIGSPDIVYHDRVGGRTVAYRPEGIALPARCPRRGFRFQAALTFQDGTQTTAAAAVPCPAATG